MFFFIRAKEQQCHLSETREMVENLNGSHSGQLKCCDEHSSSCNLFDPTSFICRDLINESNTGISSRTHAFGSSL